MTRYLSTSGPRSRRGSILVAVLWILIFLGFLAVVLRLHMSGVVASVRVTEDKEAVRVLADAGLAMGAALVRAGPQDGGSMPTMLQGNVETATGTVTVTATNETSRIDLNTGVKALLEGGLIAAGAGESTASRVAEEIIKERGIQTPAPPAPEGTPQTPQQVAQKVLFQSPAQLAEAAGLSDEVALAAEKYFTVSSGYEGVRLDALDDKVLNAIPGLPKQVAVAIRDYRQGKITYQEMQTAAAQAPYHTQDQAISWRLAIVASLPSGYTENYEAVVIISPEASAPYLVADWRRN